MSYTRVRIDGAAELERTLRQLGTEVATKLGDDADRKAAELLQDELYSAAPYDPNRDPKRPYGHLRVNITAIRQLARKAGRIVYAVGTGDAFWGRFLEFGTVKMHARPWMRPTFDRVVPKLIDEQANVLREGIERIAAQNGKG